MKKIWQLSKKLLWVFLVALVCYQVWLLGHVIWWKTNAPTETSFMALRLAELQSKNPKATLQYRWVNYEKISVHLKRAVIASEDDKFMEHNGFDWENIESALRHNQRKGSPMVGGSTITQQLAKNLFLSPKRSYLRKCQEAVISLMIENLWDKRRILEVYLNVVEWGTGVFGAEAGARRHFNQSAAGLSEYQAVRMAVLLPNPRKFERSMPSYRVNHAESVRQRMRYSRIP